MTELMQSMKLKQENDEVFYVENSICCIGRKEIDFVKSAAAGNNRKRARICTHHDVRAAVHEMLIVLAKGAYVRPHMHKGKSESFHLVEGRLAVIIFDLEGNKTEKIILSEVGAGEQFYYRLPAGIFHTVIVESDWVVFHEVTSGPFNRRDTIYPSWATEEGEENAEAQKTFIADCL